MAAKIVWTEMALEDLRSIVAYISKDDEDAARKFGFRLIRKVDVLMEFPRIGRMVAELREEHLLELVLSPYRIVYEVHGREEVVSVLRIWHAARGPLEL